MRKAKVETTTSLVLAALRSHSDFFNVRMLMAMTGREYNQVHAACFSLRKYRAADVVIETDGTGWWFALPEEQDQRIYAVEERTPESKPRKTRKRKPKK